MSAGCDALVIDPRDNVAVATRALAAGETALLGGALQTAAPAARVLRVRQPIPPYHKLALRPLSVGEAVIKYGETIGTAQRAILAGEHVHVHNLAGRRGQPQAGPEAGPHAGPEAAP